MYQVELRLSPERAASDSSIRQELAKKLKLSIHEVQSFHVRRRTIDARQRNIFINLSIDCYLQGEELLNDDFSDLCYPDVSSKKKVIVVGAGPCGLFASLRLIELGFCPILIERGSDVMQRRRDISELEKLGVVNPESNYSYGEGGAGAFSDGKLYTRSKKRGSVERILRIFCKFGSDPKILVDAHPHIGTDKLPIIIKAMREQILASGGSVHFNTRVDQFLIYKQSVQGVVCNDGQTFEGPVILATGHSARDMYRYLEKSQIQLEAKSIAVGVRLEHPQQLIDQIRYHNPKGRGNYLPPAEYVYKTQADGRGVYSFCMCPGGFVVPASTDRNQCVVNGMSPANRGSKWANSGMVVELRVEDLPKAGFKIENPQSALALMDWCEAYERASFLAGNSSLLAPAQRLTDFLDGKYSESLPSSSYRLGLTKSRMQDWMPTFISERLAKGFKAFERMSKGFITSEAQLIGVESRTSSPVRIPRQYQGEQIFQHIQYSGLYPAGEGAGYAGGIVSAAIDGENVAQALAEQFA